MIGAVVLAGGRGSRMGMPKAALTIGGSTLLEHAIEMVARVGCAPIVAAVREETPLPELGTRVTFVFDPPGDNGPLAAVEHALEETPEGSDVIVLACDLPNAGPVVRRLVDVEPTRAAAAHDSQGRPQPMCCRVPRDAALVVVRAALQGGQRRMAALLEGMELVAVAATDDELANLNTPDDLDAFRRG